MEKRVGIELELLAPAGTTRRALAEAVATRVGGEVVSNWHLDSEPSAHPDFEVFRHLTPAFDVLDADGDEIVRLVDDVTLQSDLDRRAPSPPGWYRVVSDDTRFLRMLGGRLSLDLGDTERVAAIAADFGLLCEDKGDALRLHDNSGASVALISGVPGGRSRGAECISPPLNGDQVAGWFDLVAGAATELGFLVPEEGATHLHYDAELFREPQAFQRVVWAFGEDHELIRERFGTNPNCRRLGSLPPALVELVSSAAYDELTWDEIAAKARGIEAVTKYADVNLLHLVTEKPKIPTVEFRMLPSSLDPNVLQQLHRGVDDLVDHFVA